MKRFINDKDTIVTEALDGAVALGGGALARLDAYPYIKVVTRAQLDPSKVAVVSGGGAGHEPAHAGFVGRGLLSAAVSGEIEGYRSAPRPTASGRRDRTARRRGRWRSGPAWVRR